MKDELGGKIRKEFAALGVKTFSYFIDNNNEYKKAKATKTYSIKQKLKVKDCLNQLEKSKNDTMIQSGDTQLEEEEKKPNKTKSV